MFDADPRESHGQPPVARLDEPAPLFEARSTQGLVRLADYAGRWVLLFAHPADFTPVCTSEFVALTGAAERFEALDCALIGLSVDSVYAHLAWFDRIETDFGVRPHFPLLEDPSFAIAESYGMIHPGASSTATVRSVFVIDPHLVLKAVLHYPMEVGRSVDELLRLVEALQATAGTERVTPEGWRQGGALLGGAPATEKEATDAGPNWYAGGMK